MRTTILMILLLITLPIYSTVSDESKAIEIKGKVETAQTRSLSFPLEASIEGNIVSVQFFTDMPDVTIKLIGPEGEMECRMVSCIASQMEIFYIDGFPQGTYHIKITTPRGTNLYGAFYIE